MPRLHTLSARSLDDDAPTCSSLEPGPYSVLELREAVELMWERVGWRAAVCLARECYERDPGSEALLVVVSLLLDAQNPSLARRGLRRHHRELRAPLSLDGYALYHEILCRLDALDGRPVERFRRKLSYWPGVSAAPKAPQQS